MLFLLFILYTDIWIDQESRICRRWYSFSSFFSQRTILFSIAFLLHLIYDCQVHRCKICAVLFYFILSLTLIPGTDRQQTSFANSKNITHFLVARCIPSKPKEAICSGQCYGVLWKTRQMNCTDLLFLLKLLFLLLVILAIRIIHNTIIFIWMMIRFCKT